MKIGNAAEQETIVKNNYGKDRLENGADKEKQEKNQSTVSSSSLSTVSLASFISIPIISSLAAFIVSSAALKASVIP